MEVSQRKRIQPLAQSQFHVEQKRRRVPLRIRYWFANNVTRRQYCSLKIILLTLVFLLFATPWWFLSDTNVQDLDLRNPRICVRSLVHHKNAEQENNVQYSCKKDAALLKDLVTVVFLGEDGKEGRVDFTFGEEEVAVLNSITMPSPPPPTDYVLVIPKDITTVLDTRASIRRLVEVAEATGASFVGGGIVKRIVHPGTGPVWQVNTNTCINTVQYRHWQMIWGLGYSESNMLDTKKCQMVLGPVLIRSKVLRQTPLRDLSSTHGLLEDVQMRNLGMAISCPDVLFHVDDPQYPVLPDTNVQAWMPFFREWQIERLDPGRGGVTIEANCTSEQDRLPFRDWSTGLSMTPCGMVDYCATSVCMMLAAEHVGIQMYHSDGNGLGALKFNGMPLPWEGDFDASVEKAHMPRFQALVKQMASQCHAQVDLLLPHHVIVLSDRGSKVDIWWEADVANTTEFGWSSDTRSVNRISDPPILTQQQFCGYWVNVAANPSQWHREKYGPGIYRHAPSWIQAGMADGSTPGQYTARIKDGTGMRACPGAAADHAACLSGVYDGDLSQYPFAMVRSKSLAMQVDDWR